MPENTWAASPAATGSRRESPALDDPDPPIDLVHLARQCQGDPGLEEELLGLFSAPGAARWPRNCPIRKCGWS